MGRIGNSWVLVKQSFAILRSDKELMLFPVLSALSCVLVTALVCAGGAVTVYPSLKAEIAVNPHWQPSPSLMTGSLFTFYLVNYFVMAFFNTALVAAAAVRLDGGHPTLRDGLSLAWARKGVIFQWAVLAATVGTVLKLIEQRANLIGRIVTRLLGLAWTLASFFVVPILAFEKLGPMEALRRSARLFTETWGEEVVGGLSFGLIFFLLGLPGFLLPLLGLTWAQVPGLLVGLGLMILYILLLAITSSATHGIFVAALYRYANTGEVAEGFHRGDFSTVWRHQ
jgi:hypothetical protein